jgi:hypothetical protein
MIELEVAGFDMIERANLEDRGFPDLVGRFDFVHATGILYHSPAPVLIMDHLSKVTETFLVTNTVIIPPTIRNSEGDLDFSGPAVCFLPALDALGRRILSLYFQDKLGWTQKKFDDNIPFLGNANALPFIQREPSGSGFLWREPGDLSYSPYWWLWTQQAFESLVEMFSFRILERYWYRDHALTVLCERIPAP